MDAADFWRLIDEARDGDEGDPEAQADRLRELLAGRSSEDLQAFDRLYREQLVRAYTWDLWGAGYLLAGGMGDDAFEYFCDWLIGQGRETFERVVADPDALAEVVPDGEEEELEDESLRYAVQEAHEEAHGAELPDPPAGLTVAGTDPVGEEWDEDDPDGLAKRYPRIWARVRHDWA